MLIRDLLKETGREGGRNVIAPLSVLSLLVVFFFLPGILRIKTSSFVASKC